MDTKTQARKLAEKIYRYMEPRAQLLTERPIQHIASLIEAVLEEAENRGRTDFRFIDIQRSIEQAVAAERANVEREMTIQWSQALKIDRDATRAEERERCAKIAEEYDAIGNIAKAIRGTEGM